MLRSIVNFALLLEVMADVTMPPMKFGTQDMRRSAAGLVRGVIAVVDREGRENAPGRGGLSPNVFER